MDILTWTEWGLAGAAHVATLVPTSRSERDFTNDPPRMMRARLAHALSAAVLIALLGGAAAAGAPAPVEPMSADTGQVSVAVTVRPVLECTFTDDGVIVRSNRPWVLSAATGSGEQIVVPGEPTAGEHVVLPESVGPLEVCAQ